METVSAVVYAGSECDPYRNLNGWQDLLRLGRRSLIGPVAKKKKVPPKLQPWVEARKRFGLSHAHIQMARELGLNPKKVGGLANHKQQPWKAPLPDFIEYLYWQRFRKEKPDNVRSIEQIVADNEQKKAERKARKQAEHEEGTTGPIREEDEDPF